MAGVTSAQWTGDNSPLMWALLLRAQKLAGPDLELEFPTAPPGCGLRERALETAAISMVIQSSDRPYLF